MKSRHVKIVLPCTNEGEWLRVTVDSILEHTVYPSFEILVSANGDTRTDFSFLEKPAYRNLVSLQSVKERLGVGKSINVAVTPGDADYYIFLDAHCLLEQRDWLQRVIACLEENPGVSMVQSEVIEVTYGPELKAAQPLDTSLLERKAFHYAARWAWPYEQPFQTAEVETSPLADVPYEGMAGGGMAVFARADTFHRLGKYDPEVSGWYPETMDYCVRAWLLGHPMLVDPTIRVLHRRLTSGRGYLRQYVDMVHGFLRTAYKYLSPRRRELAEILFRRHGLVREVNEALLRIHRGRWLSERVEHLRQRVHDDDWLFSRFGVHEEHFGVDDP